MSAGWGLLLFLPCSLTYAVMIDIGTGLLVAHADALELAAHVCLGSQSSIVQAIVSTLATRLEQGCGCWAVSDGS